ncbi:MAG: Kelch repeat-containing protein, partial [Thermomicrobiales bacterium]
MRAHRLVLVLLLAATTLGWGLRQPAIALADVRYAPVAPLPDVRESFATALLTDGTVLVTGGQDSKGTPLATAERYDPERDTWTSAAMMQVPRSSPTATVLHDGRVLVVGGNSAAAPPIAAELYDPASNRWTAAPPMPAVRYGQAAVLLNDG